jgi:hypothetical protein
MKYYPIISISLACLLLTINCKGQQTKQTPPEMNENIKKRALALLAENEYDETYLMSIIRSNRIEDYKPLSGNGDFFLIFEMYELNRYKYEYTQQRSTLHVIPDGDYYRMECRLDIYTFYKNGTENGHGEPSGKWYDCEKDSVCFKILQYYLDTNEL